MTIREYLRKRRTKLWLLVGGLVLLMLAVSALDGTMGLVASVATLVIFSGVMYGFGHWSRCPRCQTRLGTGVSLSTRTLAGPINYCPYCGVSLEQSVGT